jgi:DNA uptake protein ComE-like DNA-binding protein
VQVSAVETEPAGGGDGRVSLNSGSFEDYRGLGMSVTQAKRVISYREELNGYSSVDDLDRVPGFPAAFLAELKPQLRP